jgi:tetratricopeptide (TPR) repeat protein
MIAALHSRRDARAALADAAARIEAASRAFPPSAEGFSSALAVLAGAAPAFAEAVELAPALDTLQNQARTGRDRALAALPHLARSDARAAAGDWRGAAAALGEAHGLLGSLAGPELTDQLSQFRARAAAVEASLAPALASAQRAEEAMVLAADGDLDTVDWNGIDRDLAAIRKALRAAPELPSPLPAEWEAMKVRAERITRRGKVLRGVHEKIRGGRAVDAIPVLQSEATASGDPVVLAVLARLLEQTAADAATVARGWLSQAVAALSRGELGTTEAYLELADALFRVGQMEKSRAIYQRVLTWIVNKVSSTVLKAGFVVVAFLVTGKFVISALGMVLLVFMTDFVKISLATDRVRPSRSPETWNVAPLAWIALIFACAGVLSLGPNDLLKLFLIARMPARK